MPDREDTPTPAEQWDATERDIIYLLTGDDLPIWSVEDIGRDIDNPGHAEDAVRSLRTSGLLYQTSDGYVFATRAAFRLVQMVGQVA
jgi:hypothetical protein